MVNGAHAATAKEIDVSVDGSVALFNVGAGGRLDTKTMQDCIVGFVFGQKGLMADISLSGAKMTKMDK